jgi:hypothetical protein
MGKVQQNYFELAANGTDILMFLMYYIFQRKERESSMAIIFLRGKNQIKGFFGQ